MQNNNTQNLVNSLTNAASVRDLLTGKVYKKDNGRFVYDADGAIEELKDFDNPELFEVLDAGPRPVPAFSVINGKLSPEVEQGQIYVEDILARAPGIIYLAVKPLSEKAAEAGKIDIMSYKPSEDKFEKIFREVPEPTDIIDLDDGSFIFTINTVEKKTVTKEDDTEEEVNVLVRSSVNYIDEDGVVFSSYQLDYPADKTVYLKAPNGTGELVVLSTSTVKYDPDFGMEVLKPRDGIAVLRFDAESFENCKELIKGSEVQLIGATGIDSMTIDYRGDLLLRAGSLLYFSNDGYRARFVSAPAVAKTAGFDRLAKISFEDNGYTARYLLTNDSRKTVTLVDRHTKDRGHIVTVEA